MISFHSVIITEHLFISMLSGYFNTGNNGSYLNDLNQNT